MTKRPFTYGCLATALAVAGLLLGLLLLGSFVYDMTFGG